MPIVKPYSAEKRCKVIKAVKRGASITRLAKRHGITRATIHNWIRNEQNRIDFKSDQASCKLLRAEVFALKAENQELQSRVSELEMI